MNARSCFFLIVLFLIAAVSLAQPFVINEINIVGKGGRSQSIVQHMRPGASFEDWWYDGELDCIRRTGCVDIVFVMDTSGSMSSAISSLQDEIYRFAYDIAAVGFDYSFGYVTYCETVNFPHGSTLITDVDTFAEVLSGSRAGSGADEATTDGLYNAVRDFNWRDGCENVVIVITDECDDSSHRTPTETLLLLAAWGGTVYFMSADCRDVTIYRQYVDATGGIWLDYSESELSDIFNFVIDDIAEVEEINVTITNTSGVVLDSIIAEIIPDFCLMVGDSPNPVIHGPIAVGASHTFAWDIEEVPACFDWGDCFLIRVTSESYVDSMVGCVWAENCGCPGPDAWVICPEERSNWTACPYQYFDIQYEGYLGVNPIGLCIEVEGVEYCYPSSPNLTWFPEGRGGVLRFTPSAPGWDHQQIVSMKTLSGFDITDCPQLFHPFSDFKTDLHPPKPVSWTRTPGSLFPWTPARQEMHEGSVSWDPPCGSLLDTTEYISVTALIYDDGAGLTPLDELLDNFDLSLIEELDFVGIWEGLTSVGVTINGIPFVPGATPGTFNRDVDLYYELLPPAVLFGGWNITFTMRADSAALLGLAFMTGGQIEVCLHARDIVRTTGCSPCTNDTAWCCTYYVGGSIPLIVNIGPDRYICRGDSVEIGGTPPAGGGTEPYSFSWSPPSGLSDPNIGNPTASPTVTTTYTLTVIDGDSAIAIDTMTVHVSGPLADAGRDTTFSPGGYVQLGGDPTASGGFSPYTYSWSPTTGLSSATIANPMFTSGWVTSDTTITFTVAVTDTLGCVATDDVTITVMRIIVDLALPDTLLCPPGGFFDIPIYCEDLTDMGITEMDIEVEFFDGVLEPVDVVLAGTVASGWPLSVTIESNSMRITGTGPELMSGGVLFYLRFYIPEMITEGSYSPLNFRRAEFNGGSVSSNLIDGFALVCFQTHMWSNNLIFSISPQSPRILTFGVTGSATCGFDPGLDIRAIPTPSTHVEGYFHLSDSLYPLHDRLERDMRGPEPLPIVWTGYVVSPIPSTVNCKWNPADFPPGSIYMTYTDGGITRTVNMKRVDEITFGTSTEFTITYNQPELGRTQIVTCEGWNLISFPFVPSESLTIREIVPHAITDGYWYNPSASSYAFAYSPEPGKGYWVFCTEGDTFDVGGMLVDVAQLDIRMGWSLLGMPWHSSGTLPISALTSEPDVIVPTNIFGYDACGTRAYFSPSVFVVGQGYWLLSTGNALMTIDGESELGKEMTVFEPRWTFTMSLDDMPYSIGIDDRASTKIDAFDRAIPPPAPDGGGIFGGYAEGLFLSRDVRPLSNAEFEIFAAGKLLSWNPSDISPEFDLFLVNGNSRIDMRKSANATLTDRAKILAHRVLPDAPTLYSAVPNPFNASVELKFAVPSAGQAELVIYDLLGKRVSTIFKGDIDADIHSTIWDGKSDEGIEMPSGMYFYRLVFDDAEAVTRSMVLLR